MPVVQLIKRSPSEPCDVAMADVTVRNMVMPEEIDVWLAIQNACFRRVRPWVRSDFDREFDGRKDHRILMADFTPKDHKNIGTISLKWQPASCQASGDSKMAAELGYTKSATISWLAVLPQWQRRGVGRQLLATAEHLCWEHGAQTIQLETLSSWSAALRLYTQAGYQPISGD